MLAAALPNQNGGKNTPNLPPTYWDASFFNLLQVKIFQEASQAEQLAMVEIANQLGTTQQLQKNKDFQFEEVPSQRKIIEKRKFLGKLKVFASWYLIWNTIHQIVWDLIFAIVLCNMLVVCTNSNLPALRASRILLATCTSIVHINMRMNSKAKKRWKLKYGDVD